LSLRTAVGLATCAFALAAQFWPKTSAVFTVVQVVCIVMYAVLSMVLQVSERAPPPAGPVGHVATHEGSRVMTA